VIGLVESGPGGNSQGSSTLSRELGNHVTYRIIHFGAIKYSTIAAPTKKEKKNGKKTMKIRHLP